MNQQKHGISFEDVMHVFEDPYALFDQDRTDEAGESRWQALSARRATREEGNRNEQTRA